MYLTILRQQQILESGLTLVPGWKWGHGVELEKKFRRHIKKAACDDLMKRVGATLYQLIRHHS